MDYRHTFAFEQHLHILHHARMAAVQVLLPPGDVILDLGGANSPLHHMGYPHPFKRLYMIDLPPERRHEMYANIQVEGRDDVLIHFSDMTELKEFEDQSVDLVWSGQSIEHVPEDAGRRMVEEAFRVLKPGGSFCLDTPNGIITSVHAATSNLKFIHPEHCIDLCRVLESAGFSIRRQVGIQHMPKTSTTGSFDYLDFIDGVPLTHDVNASYIQLYHCQKPRL